MLSSFEIQSDYSNWIIPGYIMCGPYPYCDGINFNEEEGKENIKKIMNDGIDTFVCLCSEISIEEEERESHPYFPDFRSYKEYVLSLNENAIFKYYPIQDGGIPKVKDLTHQIDELLSLISGGKKLYIHCAGGHGRTNIYTAILTSVLLNLNPGEALKHVFDQRRERRRRDRKLDIYNIPVDDRHLIFNHRQEEMVYKISYYFMVKKELK